MSNRSWPIVLALFLMPFGSILAQEEAELETLFTTPQERQVINSNRYKQDKKGPVRSAVEPSETAAIRGTIREQITQSYRISGISVSTDGTAMAWINSAMIENGARLEDGARVRINDGNVKSVTIITPDGKRHTGTSGETLDVTYSRVVEE